MEAIQPGFGALDTIQANNMQASMERSYSPVSRLPSTEPEPEPEISRPRSQSMHHQTRRSKSNARGQTPGRTGRSRLSRQGSLSARNSSGQDTDRQATPSQQKSRAKSLPGRAGRIKARATFLEDIKHEVMVNYLYQQQCSHLWVSDGNGVLEGVVVRKTADKYMSCPPELANSAFAQSMAALGVQVSSSSSLEKIEKGHQLT